MTKGKAQRVLEHTLFELSHSSTELSDPAYLALGAELEQGPLLTRSQNNQNREVVGVHPSVERSGNLTFRATPLGMLAPTLFTALGVEELVVEGALAAARPRCRSCDRGAVRSSVVDCARIPPTGFVALVVDGAGEEVSLRERCELLGLERVVINHRLERADEISDEDGDPVLVLLEAKRTDELSREIELWFGRGGGALSIMHFRERGAAGSVLQRVFQGWRCDGCAASFVYLSREAIESSPPCVRCRGEGWLLVEDDRYVACEGCEGFGRSSQLADYEVGDTRLSLVPLLSLEEVVARGEFSLGDRDTLEGLVRAGLGGYRIGAPAAYLSKGERAVVALASATVSKVADLDLLVDLGALPSVADLVRGGASREPNVIGYSPRYSYLPLSPEKRRSGGQVEIRELSVGPLAGESASFECGEVTLVSGVQGSGKSLVLKEVYRRFQKRKKLAGTSAFGTIKSVELIVASDQEVGTVGELARIGLILAEVVSATRDARERGLLEEDLLTSRSKYLCAECRGTGLSDGSLCPACEGALFEPRVGETVFRDTTVRELFQRPLAFSLERLGLNDAIEALRTRLPKDLLESYALGTPLKEVSPGVRRFLSVYTPLCYLMADAKRASSSLVLIDEPFGCCAEHQALIASAMGELCGQGATVVCAGVTRPLEKLFGSVLRLEPYEVSVGDRRAMRYYDMRTARRFRVSRL